VDIAFVRKGSEDLVVALLPERLRHITATDRRLFVYGISEAAKSVHLDGRIISIWEDERGSRQVDAPSDLLPFCDLLTICWVRKNLSLRLLVA
jgi:hypothetical protein